MSAGPCPRSACCRRWFALSIPVVGSGGFASGESLIAYSLTQGWAVAFSGTGGRTSPARLSGDINALKGRGSDGRLE